MDKSQVKWLYISIGFSLLVLVIILFLTINENTIQILREINPVFLLLAFLAHILTMCFWAWRIQKMSGSLGYRIGFFYSLNLVFANLLMAAITPSQAGGEPVRIHELYRANVPLGDATAIVIMERVLDGIVLALLAAFAMIVLADQWKSLGVISQIMVLYNLDLCNRMSASLLPCNKAAGQGKKGRSPCCQFLHPLLGEPPGGGIRHTD